MIVISLFAHLFICISFYQIDAQPPTPSTPPTTTTTTHSPLKPTFINGSVLPVTSKDFKFQLSLEFQDNFHFCSAAFVLEPHSRFNPGVTPIQVGITAAQCFQHNIYPIYAVAGTTDLRVRNATAGYQRVLVTRVDKHDQFNNHDDVRSNDIAIVYFDQPFNITSWVGPLGRVSYDPKLARVPANEPLLISGWGQMYPPGQVNENILQIFSTGTMISHFCERTWVPGFTKKSMGCYNPPKKLGPGNCYGDAGAPVLWFIKNGKSLLVGLVSYGHDCFYDKYPGVFTFLPYYIDWIDNKTLAHINSNVTG